MQVSTEKQKSTKKKDVYFIHNNVDRESVHYLAEKLTDEYNLDIWLDEWDLVAGEHFTKNMYKGLQSSKACAVFISDKTPKGWVNEEITQALVRHNKNGNYRIIPVLLPNAKIKNLRNFLETRTYVKFDRDLDDKVVLHQLISGIKGLSPGRVQKSSNSKQIKEFPSPINLNLTLEVKITIDHDFENFDEETKRLYLKHIAEIIGSQPIVKNISKGSVILTLELLKEDAKKLKAAFHEGKLKFIAVKSVDLIQKEEKKTFQKPLKFIGQHIGIEPKDQELQIYTPKLFNEQLAKATELVTQIINSNKTVMFVGSEIGIKNIVANIAHTVKMPSVTIGWRKGQLLKDIRKAAVTIKSKRPLHQNRRGQVKSSDLYSNHRRYVSRILGDKIFLPSAIVIVYPSIEISALQEANLVNVPVIGIGNELVLKGRVDYPIIIKQATAQAVEKVLRHLIQSPSYTRKGKQDQPTFE